MGERQPTVAGRREKQNWTLTMCLYEEYIESLKRKNIKLMNKKVHLHYVDNLKAFLILLVVLGHCVQFTDSDFDHNIVFRYIYSFHMPLFMFVSGFLSYKPQTTWYSVKKRFFQLMLPFISWGMVGCIIETDQNFINVIFYPDKGLWFLWTLFFIVLLKKVSYIMARFLSIKEEYSIITFVVILFLVQVLLKINVFGVNFITIFFPYYIMGEYSRKYNFLSSKKLSLLSPIFFVIFVFLASFWMRIEQPAFMSGCIIGGFTRFYSFVTASFAIVSFMILFRKYLNKSTSIFNQIGEKTLGIYAIHQPIIKIIVGNISVDISYCLYVFILFVVVFVISFIIYKILTLNKYTALLFVGK